MLQYIASFIFVLALIGLVGWILKQGLRTGGIPLMPLRKNKENRIQILEVTMLDPQRRLILIRRDNNEHLILTGGPNDLVLETNIPRAMPIEENSPALEQTDTVSRNTIPDE